jgi:hypothetical protein
LHTMPFDTKRRGFGPHDGSLSPQSRPCCPKKTGMRQHSSGTVGGVFVRRMVGTNEKSTVTTSDPALCGLSAIIDRMTPKKSQRDIGANLTEK